jgi:hypothetical protein
VRKQKKTLIKIEALFSCSKRRLVELSAALYDVACHHRDREVRGARFSFSQRRLFQLYFKWGMFVFESTRHLNETVWRENELVAVRLGRRCIQHQAGLEFIAVTGIVGYSFFVTTFRF